MDLFPDQSYIDRVAEELWRPGGEKASVMIGAGFSRNALGKLGANVSVPNWSDIAWAMSKKLYGETDTFISETKSELSAEKSLALAQEFEVAFGRADLHRFLKEQINDDYIQPSEAHNRLLTLPWRDVFTTNWDTLLEKASEVVTSRSYEVLRTLDEIAIANAPRIVKLHGSLPAKFPLIVTEEDYRRYPTQFAPFVNTVQQAMMETIVLLLGFSGRDPNFLQWSGWVRDQLGSSAPKIYMAGWLDLDAHERRVLENRNVAPIDLALHPKNDEWRKKGDVHRHSLEWILHSLERAKPYQLSNWPIITKSLDHSPPEHLQPIKQIDLRKPEREPQNENDEVNIQEVLRVWKHNRELYPGWLAIPASKQGEISYRTASWEARILSETKNWLFKTRFEAIYEIVWRHRFLLETLDPSVAQAAHEVFERAIALEASGEEPSQRIDRKAINFICAELLVYERLSLNREAFDHLVCIAVQRAAHDMDLEQTVSHERCLWALYRMDFDQVRSILKEWRTDQVDPFWKVRKASVMLEVGIDAGVEDLVKEAILYFRRHGSGERNISEISREAWAMLLMDYIEDNVVERHQGLRDTKTEKFARYDSDVWSELDVFRRSLDSASVEPQVSMFDLGVEKTTVTSFTVRADRAWATRTQRNPALVRCIRLGDVMGLPPVAGRWLLTGSLLTKSARELHAIRDEFAFRLMLRVVRTDGNNLIDDLLSRTTVASLSEASIQTLIELCKRMLAQATSHFGSTPALGGASRIERIRVAVEVLSRLSVRVSGSKAVETFVWALSVYEDQSVVDHLWAAKPIQNLLLRTWQALTPTERADLVLDVLESSILGFEGFILRSMRIYPEPGHVFISEDMNPPHRTEENENRWVKTISFLARAVVAEGETRIRAASRLAQVAIWKMFNEDELVIVANALWKFNGTISTELPKETGLRDWVFLILPEPDSGVALQAFRQKWLTPLDVSPMSEEAVDETLWELGDAKCNERRYKYSVEFSEQEVEYLRQLISVWSKTPLPQPRPILDQTRARTSRATIGCAELLKHISVPQSVSEELLKKLNLLEEHGHPGLRLAPALVDSLPEQVGQIISIMRHALASDDRRRAQNAVRALYIWLRGAAEQAWNPPPTDLIREVGVIVAALRRSALADALSLVEWVFLNGNDESKKLLKDLVLEGMRFLLSELDYERVDMNKEFDVPLVRWRCAAVASAMKESGVVDETIDRWISASENDPMPEVRHAGEETQFRKNT